MGISAEKRGQRHQLPELEVLDPPEPYVISLAEKAYLLLRDRIITLRLPPGSLLHESELANEMQVGRTPVREALKRLAEDSLVTILPRRGTFVTDININDITHISEIRVELESLAASLAAKRGTDQQKASLLAHAREHERVRDHPAQTQVIRSDINVHQHIHQSTQNPFLSDTLERYLILSVRLWFALLPRLERLRNAPMARKTHLQIAEAITAGDATEAKRLMRRHVSRFLGDFRRVL
ncbi:MAG: GntR family transcriptional regulator [bacterium]